LRNFIDTDISMKGPLILIWIQTKWCFSYIIKITVHRVSSERNLLRKNAKIFSIIFCISYFNKILNFFAIKTKENSRKKRKFSHFSLANGLLKMENFRRKKIFAKRFSLFAGNPICASINIGFLSYLKNVFLWNVLSINWPVYKMSCL